MSIINGSFCVFFLKPRVCIKPDVTSKQVLVRLSSENRQIRLFESVLKRQYVKVMYKSMS